MRLFEYRIQFDDNPQEARVYRSVDVDLTNPVERNRILSDACADYQSRFGFWPFDPLDPTVLRKV